MDSKQQPGIFNLSRLCGVFLLLFLAAGIIYTNSLQNEFVFDDRHVVVNNLFIRDFKNIPVLFKTGLHHFENVFQGEGNFYRPVVGLSYMADYSLYGLKPSGYHITNLLLHVLVAFLVYMLIYALFRKFALSLGTAFIFLIHPVQTEAVTYISGRADPVTTLFILLYLIFFIMDMARVKSKNFLTRNFLLANIALFAALLSKEISVISLPLLILVFCTYNRKNESEEKKKISFLYPYFACFIILFFLYLHLRSGALGGLPGLAPGLNLKTRLLTTIAVIPLYFRIIFYPVGLHMERSVNLVTSISDIRLIFSAVFIFVIVFFAAAYGKRSKYVAFSSLWFFIGLLPYLNIVPLNAEMAEHWLYIPLVGISTLVVYVSISIYKALTKRVFRYAILFVYGGIIMVLGVLTIKQNAYWEDEATFFAKTLEYSPKSVRILSNLAAVHLEKGEYEKSIELYKKGIQENPREYQLYNNLAAIYIEAKKYKEAEKMLLEAVAIHPKTAFPYNNLGVLYEREGRYGKAKEAFRNAVKNDNNFFEAHYNLGILLDREGNASEARKHFKRVEQINPRYKNTRLFLEKYKGW